MTKINPKLERDLQHIFDLVDQLGLKARGLVHAGLTTDDLKKMVRQRFGVQLGTRGAALILEAIRKVWDD